MTIRAHAHVELPNGAMIDNAVIVVSFIDPETGKYKRAMSWKGDDQACIELCSDVVVDLIEAKRAREADDE